MYEILRPQLKNLDRWIAEWESDEEEQQKLFLEIANVAEEAGEDEYVHTTPHHTHFLTHSPHLAHHH